MADVRPRLGSTVRSNRILAAIVTCAAIAAPRIAIADAASRAELLYLAIIPLAYGHLLGALFGSRPLARHSAAGPRIPLLAFQLVSLCSLFALYSAIVAAPLLIAMAAVSVVHVVENDLALAGARGLALGPISRSADRHIQIMGVVALAGFAAASTEEGRSLAAALGLPPAAAVIGGLRWLAGGSGLALLCRRSAPFAGGCLTVGAMLPSAWIAAQLALDELVLAPLLYHAVSWLLQTRSRVQALRAQGAVAAARRMRRRVVTAHGAPLLLTLVALQRPTDEWSGVYLAISSPAVLFFLSATHALHTAWVRGVERRCGAEPGLRSCAA